MLAGLFFLAFSREKNESQAVAECRNKAMLWTFHANTAFLLLGVSLVYGIGFIHVLVLSMFSPFVIYLLLFRVALFRTGLRQASAGIRETDR